MSMGTLMSEKDSVTAFCEGAGKAASAARELARMNSDVEWAHLAETFECMRENVVTLSRMKSMSRTEQLQALNIKSKAGLPY